MPPRDREFNSTTRTEFEMLVKQLISAAHDNHIGVEGGTDVRHLSMDAPD